MVQTDNSLTLQCPFCGKPFPRGSPACLSCFLKLGLEEDVAEGSRLSPAPSQSHASTPRYFGDYEILREVGRGGMGIVYEARQLGTRRTVALKLLAAGALATREAVHRFHTEAKAAALLEHSNIVPIFEVGAHNGEYFLAMRFMPGGTLAERLATPVKEAAELLRQIALAVQHAHERGILHRDLKPGNILLDSAGRPQVTDFGLARLTEEQTVVTLSGAVLGTAAYMAPEQAIGASTTTASDIYSLGAILYELLSGEPPFRMPTLHATLRAIVEQPPLSPWAVRARSSGRSESELRNAQSAIDLETICLKCLEKEPSKRYHTAQALADDLQRFLNNEPITARPITRTAKLIRWSQRNPALATAYALMLLFLLTLLIGSPLAVLRINDARNSAVLQRNRAEAAAQREALLRRQAEAASYTSDINLAKQAWDEGNLGRAQQLLRAHIPEPNQPDLRGFEWRYLWRLCQDESLHTVLQPNDPVLKLAATPAHSFVAAAWDKNVRLLESATGLELARLPFPNPDALNPFPVIALASRATNLLAGHRAQGVVGLWDLQTRTLSMTFNAFSNNVGALALSPDGRLLAAADRGALYSTRLAVWALSDGVQQPHLLWSLPVEDGIAVLAFSPDGRFLVAPRGGPSLQILDAATGREINRIPKASAGFIQALAFSPDGTQLAASGVEGRVKIWDFATLSLKGIFDGSESDVQSLAFSPDGESLLASGSDRAIHKWNLLSHEHALRRGASNGTVNAVFTPDGRFIVSATGPAIKIWSAETREPARLLQANAGWSVPLISPNGRWLAVSTSVNSADPKGASIWDLTTARHHLNLVYKGTSSQPLAFAPDGSILAVGTVENEGLVGLWHTEGWEKETGELSPFAYITNGFEAGSLTFSPDGKILSVAGLAFSPFLPKTPSGATNRLAFWEVGSWRKLDLLPGAGAGPTEWAAAGTTAFSPDGRLFAIGFRDGRIRLWDFRAQRLLHEFDLHDKAGWSASVTFSKNSRWLAAFSRGGTSVNLFDLSDFTRPRVLPIARDSSDVHGVEFTPDSKSLATAHNDGLIKFWNLETGSLALALRHSHGPGVSISFAPDGNLLASKDAHGLVKLWPAGSLQQTPATNE